MPTGDQDQSFVPRTVLALFASPCFGALCGGLCGLGGGAWLAPFTGIFGGVVGLLCFPALTSFYMLGHTFPESVLGVFAPAAVVALAGGFVGLGLGMVLSIVAYLLCAFHVDFPGANSRTKFPKGHCERCGYDLKGLDNGQCPECGWSFERS